MEEEEEDEEVVVVVVGEVGEVGLKRLNMLSCLDVYYLFYWFRWKCFGCCCKKTLATPFIYSTGYIFMNQFNLHECLSRRNLLVHFKIE
jgi:hypothetical protein